MKSTAMTNSQEGTSKDLSRESLIPTHQMNPQIGSSDSGNYLVNYSTQQSCLTSLLEAILEESDVEENRMRSKLLVNQLGRTKAMNESQRNHGGENDQRELRCHINLDGTKTIGSKGSLYQGVIKCYDRRFEAFAWDNTGERGKIVYIGAYSNEIDAAKAHDMVSIKIRGSRALINFPGMSYSREIEFMQKMSKNDYIENVRGRGSDYTIECESPFRGVYRVPDKRKWEARLGRKGLRTISLGAYYTAEDAARAYDIIKIKLKGWEAITNFDISSYEVKSIMKSVITQQMDGSIILRIPERNNEAEANSQRNSSVQHNPRQLRNSSLSPGCQNSNVIASNLGIEAYPHSSLGQSNPQQWSNSSSSHGYQNPNLIPSNLGIQAYPQSSSLGQSISQQLTNSSLPYGFQDPNLMPSNYGFQAYPQSSSLGQHNTLGGFTSIIENSGNSIANLGGEFPDQNATLQHSLQTQNQVINVNNNFYLNLLNNDNNNHFLPQSSNTPLLANVTQNLELENSLHFPNYPFDFGKKLLGGDKEFGSLSTLSALYAQSGALPNAMVNGSTGATNGACSSGSVIQPVVPSNQEIGPAQLQLSELNQSYEPCSIQVNTLNLQNPHQNLSSFFSEGFQNPSSQPNNTGSQSHAIGSENDLGMIDFLNRSFIEDNDFACDFDFFAGMNGDKQGL